MMMNGDQEMCILSFRYIISHNYTTTGQFEVTANVTNQVSWRGQTLVAKVEEPIAGIEVTSDYPQIIKLGTKVVVRATVASGNDLSFDWDFSVDEHINGVRLVMNEILWNDILV